MAIVEQASRRRCIILLVLLCLPGCAPKPTATAAFQNPTPRLPSPLPSPEPSNPGSPIQAPAEDATSAALSGGVRWLNDLADERRGLVLSSDTPLLWGVGWCAATREDLERNLSSIRVELIVNGAMLHPSTYAQRTYGSDDSFNPSYCRGFFVLLHSWPSGDTLLRSNIVISESLSDGRSQFAPQTITAEYSLSSVPRAAEAFLATPGPTPVQSVIPRVRQTIVPFHAQPEPFPGLGGMMAITRAFPTENQGGPPLESGDHLLLMLPSLEERPLPGDQPLLPAYSVLNTSPDRDTLAYLSWGDQDHSALMLVTPDGSLLPTPGWPLSLQWEELAGWLDLDRILWVQAGDEPGTARTFSISSGASEVIPPSFPFETEEGPLSTIDFPQNLPHPSYDPTLTRVALTRSNKAAPGPPTGSVELWDAEGASQVWSTDTWSWQGSKPTWSPNGKEFIVSLIPRHVGSDPFEERPCSELHLVTTDGRDTTLASCIWGLPSWSPDGRLVAAWWVAGDDPCFASTGSRYSGTRLSLIHRDTGDISIFALCPADNGMIPPNQYPIWSPDGRYIALNQWTDGGYSNSVVVLDTAEANAQVLLPDAFVKSWIGKRPSE